MTTDPITLIALLRNHDAEMTPGEWTVPHDEPFVVSEEDADGIAALRSAAPVVAEALEAMAKRVAAATTYTIKRWLTIERTEYSTDIWAIRRNGDVWTRNNEWEWEPMPSSRDDDFLGRARWTLEEAWVAARSIADNDEPPPPRKALPVTTSDTPIPMLIWCSQCRERHVDIGEFATKPHHTHACQRCGNVWRPALVATVGVRFLPGFKNEKPSRAITTQPIANCDGSREFADRPDEYTPMVKLMTRCPGCMACQ